MTDSPLPPPSRPLVEINAVGLRALVRALGVADTARFLNQYGPVRGDYTAEREAQIGHMGMREAAEWVRRHAAASTP